MSERFIARRHPGDYDKSLFTCDAPGCFTDVGFPWRCVNRLEALLKKHKWEIRDGKHYCPDCPRDRPVYESFDEWHEAGDYDWVDKSTLIWAWNSALLAAEAHWEREECRGTDVVEKLGKCLEVDE